MHKCYTVTSQSYSLALNAPSSGALNNETCIIAWPKEGIADKRNKEAESSQGEWRKNKCLLSADFSTLRKKRKVQP